MTLQELLNKEPEHVKVLNGGEYIPIGWVEKYLDEIDPYWSSYNFKMDSFVGANGMVYMISASIELRISNPGTTGDSVKTSCGSATIMLSGNEENKDYAATLQSLCIANAAKRMGRRFGRELNNRLDMGESAPTQEPVNIELPDETTAERILKKSINNK